MEELIKKFEEIENEYIFEECSKIHNPRASGIDHTKPESISIKCAQEAKKIVLIFCSFIEFNCKFDLETKEYFRITNDPEVEPKNFCSASREKMFEIFIKEYYSPKQSFTTVGESKYVDILGGKYSHSDKIIFSSKGKRVEEFKRGMVAILLDMGSNGHVIEGTTADELIQLYGKYMTDEQTLKIKEYYENKEK